MEVRQKSLHCCYCSVGGAVACIDSSLGGYLGNGSGNTLGLSLNTLIIWQVKATHKGSYTLFARTLTTRGDDICRPTV